LASKKPASPARTTSQEVPSAPKKAARKLASSFTSVVPARIAINMRPPNLTVSSWPKKEVMPASKNEVYRSIADKMFDATAYHRENLIRENINNIIVRELDAALRCIPDSHDVDQQTLSLYSFIVGPLLDSLTKPYANWDKIPLADVYNVMYYWRPAARPVSMNNGMSAKFLHDWNICRNRMVQYGLTFP
jgi:hypothetical protein